MASRMSCLLSRSSDRRSQHFCDVCKYMFRMDRSNGHNNRCSNRVFKVYAYCHHCSTVHEVPHRLGSTMLCLSNSSLSNTTHCNLVHPHPTVVNNESAFYHGIDDMDNNDDSSKSNIVDCCRMMMSKIMFASIGEWRVGQTQHGAVKSMRNFMHSGAVMTVGIHFEYMIWALIIVPIALIHSEHEFAYITEVLRAAIGWSW